MLGSLYELFSRPRVRYAFTNSCEPGKNLGLPHVITEVSESRGHFAHRSGEANVRVRSGNRIASVNDLLERVRAVSPLTVQT